jgi:hypothetical protein
MPPGTSKGIKKKGSDPEFKIHRTAVAFQRDDNPDISFWAEDEPLVHSFGSDVDH